jgi:ribose-phosphate pyrophosphokinase
LTRFSDGEVSIKIDSDVRGKDVVIIQPSANPVNDSIMELLLTISCARRAGANRIIAVIPYFGYKHHRRGASISTKHNSRFLSSGAMDFAKMLQELGVDRIISVDLQRPGQGQEACFFDNNVPVETIITTDLFIEYISKNIDLKGPITIVTPNAECVKKARKFQLGIQKNFPNSEVKLLAFFAPNYDSGPVDARQLELIGKGSVSYYYYYYYF